jgi:hypothetical protein
MELTVHERHLELVLEVADRPEARVPPPRLPDFLAKSASRPSKVSTEIPSSAPTGGAEHRLPLLDREERLLGRIARHRHDHPVGQRETPPDEVFMPACGRVERAGIQRNPGHGQERRTQKVRRCRRTGGSRRRDAPDRPVLDR